MATYGLCAREIILGLTTIVIMSLRTGKMFSQLKSGHLRLVLNHNKTS